MPEEGDEEEGIEEISLPPEYRNVRYRVKEFKIEDLFKYFIEGKLILEPDFQRHYVWDRKKASRFIESLILNLPTPLIYLAENENGSFDVIDGHQRLETIFKYLLRIIERFTIDRGLIERAKEKLGARLILKECQVLTELNGKGIEAIPDRTTGEGGVNIITKEEFLERKLRAIIITKEAHPDMKYILFSRLNMGSMQLNWQEIRNCLYRGPYNDLIRELSEDPRFLRCIGMKKPHKRMKEREYVLRFFAFAHRIHKYRKPLQLFLNKEMEEVNESLREASEDEVREKMRRFKEEFEHAFNICLRVFGEERVFRMFKVVGENNRPPGSWDRRISNPIYEIEMVGFHKYGERFMELYNKLSEEDKEYFLIGVRRELVKVMTESKFTETLGRSYERYNVNTRFEMWEEALRRILKNYEQIIEEACKVHELLARSNMCSLCPDKIEEIEDACLRGEEENQLAHIYCLRSIRR